MASVQILEVSSFRGSTPNTGTAYVGKRQSLVEQYDVIRIQFRVGAQGATQFQLRITGFAWGTDGIIPNAYTYVTKDPYAKLNAFADDAHDAMGTCTLAWDGVTKSYVYTSTTNVNLLPNEWYYLFIYPQSWEYGYAGNQKLISNPSAYITFTTSGNYGGIIYIRNAANTGYEQYQPWIFNGSTWELYEPRIYNGANWNDIYS